MRNVSHDFSPEPTGTERTAPAPPKVEAVQPLPAPNVSGRAPAPPRAAVSSSPHTLEDERVLLDGARAALANGDGPAALAATAAHARKYPDGFLAEEREAIAIQALLLLGRYDEARQREAAFELRYPHSPLLQAVRASIQSIP